MTGKKDMPPDDERGNVVRGPWGVEDLELRTPDDMHVQHCYRHPDRETGVSCSNCGRPICWECMTPAPVGFRCPECMGRTRKERKAAPVVTRGQMRRRWSGSLGGTSFVGGETPVTLVLIGLNVLVFLAQIVTSGGGIVTGSSGGTLYEWGALWPPSIAYDHEYWRLVTPMFLHGSIAHILMNMVSLWFIGSVLERMIGSGRFLTIYLVSGLAGNALVFAIGPELSPVVGASTAIFGVFGALFIFGLHDRGAWSSAMVRTVGALLLFNLVFTFAVSGISWQGHVGGLIGGVLASEALLWFGRRRLSLHMTTTDLLLLAGVAALFVVLIVWRVLTFPILY